MRWWHFGLIGGGVLSAATAIKLVRALIGGRAGKADWSEAAGFGMAVFAMDFLCGFIVWAGKGLHRRFGMVGDAIVGLAVMVAFSVCCMWLFHPAMLGAKFASSGVFIENPLRLETSSFRGIIPFGRGVSSSKRFCRPATGVN